MNKIANGKADTASVEARRITLARNLCVRTFCLLKEITPDWRIWADGDPVLMTLVAQVEGAARALNAQAQARTRMNGKKRGNHGDE